ncbi:MAG: Xaa-Pro peptidase family protein [Deltaproteobacteria bacterium]
MPDRSVGTASAAGGGSREVGRIRELLRAMARRRVDPFLCTHPANIRYLTGFSGSDAALLVSGDAVTLVTDGRYREQARLEVRGAEVVITDRKWGEIARRIRKAERSRGTGRSRRTGFESQALPVATFRRLARNHGRGWVPLAGLVEAFRMRKDEGELRAMEAAAIVASGALLQVLERGMRGLREGEVAARLAFGMRMQGADGESFRAIVASGPRSAMPHAVPTEARIGRGDPVLIDLGARRLGYCSDETVTILPERPRGGLSRIHDAVRRAQEAGIRAVRPGVLCREVDARVRESLDRSGLLKYFVHSTGHGVGLEIHERPSVSMRSPDRLAEGMVITVEPGVYIPGLGGVRIEDMVRVTDSGRERMTYLPKSGRLAA